MFNLTSSWDNVRKQLIEAVLSCEASPLQTFAAFVWKAKFMCQSCDEKVHKSLPFHDRDAYVNGYFQAIPPTVGVDEKGYRQIKGNFTYPFLYILFINCCIMETCATHILALKSDVVS